MRSPKHPLAFQTITNAAELVQWATYINNSIGMMNAGEKADLQDVYARSLRADLDNAFIFSNNERKLVICSVNNLMAFEEVEHLLSFLARHKVNQERQELYNDFDKRESNLDTRERTFKDMMKPYHKRLADMKHKMAMLETQAVSLQRLADNRLEETRKARKDANEYHEKAIKLDAIRAALA